MTDKYNLLKIFRKHLELKIDISEGDWKTIARVTQIVPIAKGSHLLQNGEVFDKHVFVLQGCLRTYLVDDQKQVTLLFNVEKSWANEPESLFTKTPSRFNIDAIEHTWAAVIRDEDFVKLYESVRGLKEYNRQLFLESFTRSKQRLYSIYFTDATQRYKLLLKESPQIVLKAPQHMIASYLKMNAETLSRIRRKVVSAG
jgi:CRP-like cAMP-binding protein